MCGASRGQRAARDAAVSALVHLTPADDDGRDRRDDDDDENECAGDEQYIAVQTVGADAAAGITDTLLCHNTPTIGPVSK